MRFRGIGRMRAVARRLGLVPRPRALILLYHRIAEVSYDPHGLCVTPRHFAEHLEVLRQQTDLVRLRDLDQVLDGVQGPERAVAVTFDDGYADNLASAKPWLERFEAPAAVFVASGYLGSSRGFWWHELEQIVIGSEVLPETLEISVQGRVHRWKDGLETESGAGLRGRDSKRAPSLEQPQRERQSLYRALQRLLRPLGAEERRAVLDQLRSWAGRPTLEEPSSRPLSTAEVGRLAADGLVEIGAHSVSHPLLPARPGAEQADEIGRSRRDLEAIAERPVTRFAYPFNATSALTERLVRESGFSRAYGGTAALDGSIERFRVPRLQVADGDGDQFARQLREWFRR
jgi:peptidoglycan/xylan/chitin deacetylase (PgdA/CDA1 family)